MKLICIFYILLTFTPIFGQETYNYRLEASKSSYSLIVNDTILGDNACRIQLSISDTLGEKIPFVDIQLVGEKTNAHFTTEFSGDLNLKLPSDTFFVRVTSMSFAPLQFDALRCKPNTLTTINVVLETSNSGGTMSCSRMLTQDELDSVRNDLRNGKYNNALFRNKTCRINWKI